MVHALLPAQGVVRSGDGLGVGTDRPTLFLPLLANIIKIHNMGVVDEALGPRGRRLPGAHLNTGALPLSAGVHGIHAGAVEEEGMGGYGLEKFISITDGAGRLGSGL